MVECKGIEVKKKVLLLLDLQLKRKVVIWRIRLSVRTQDFHSWKRDSTSLCATRIDFVAQ